MDSNNNSPSQKSNASSRKYATSQASSQKSPSRTQTPRSPRGKDQQLECVKELNEQKDKYDLSKLNELKTEELRKMKSAAINLYLYDISDKAQQIINKRNKDNFGTVIKQEKEWLAEGIYQVLGNFDSNLIELNQEYDQKELEIREIADRVFEKMKKRHIQEIQDLKLSERTEQLAEENRQSNNSYGEVILQLSQSKKLAAVDQVQEAKSTWANAIELSKKLSEENLQTIEKKYQTLLNQLKTRQLEELNNFQENLASSLNANQVKREKDIDALEKSVSVAIQSSLQKAVYDATNSLKSKDRIPDILSVLSEFVDTTQKEYREEQKPQKQSNSNSPSNSVAND